MGPSRTVNIACGDSEKSCDLLTLRGVHYSLKRYEPLVNASADFSAGISAPLHI